MSYYAFIFLGGIAGSFHCVGMCGGFACTVGANCTGGRVDTVLRQLLYNGGRLTVYAFLGALAGSVALVLNGKVTPEFVASGQKVLTVAAGAIMVIIALNLLGFQRFKIGAATGGNVLVSMLGTLSTAHGRTAPLAFGIFNGFLPCPLVYAFLAQAIATGSALKGTLTMVALGLGTFPAMMTLGWLGNRFRPDWRQRGVTLAGYIILVLGFITIARIFVNPSVSVMPS